MFFNSELDAVLAVVFAILMIVFFLGKGEGILDLFGPKNNPNKKKRTKEEERQYQKYLGFFMLPLTVRYIPIFTLSTISFALSSFMNFETWTEPV